jgi:pyruvate kinase
MKKTKIVATISDKTCTKEFIQSLYEKGMNVVRLNTAHQDHNDALKVIEMVREVSDKIAILLDTKGPEIRTNKMQEITVEAGDIVYFKGEYGVNGEKNLIRVSHNDFAKDVKVGSKILIDDGLIEFKAIEKTGEKLKCEVVNSGVIQGNKSINIPSAMIKLPALTEKDMNFIKFAAEQKIDFVAHSFVRRPDDVIAVQSILDLYDSDIKIIAKIENHEGVENIDAILEHAYGIMIARGDLAIEISEEKIPIVQKDIIKKCNRKAKPVIVATQMLHSMIKNPRPTRAEVNDVANAILDGADAIMLSGETAYGQYPLESVMMMSKIANQVENNITDINKQEIIKLSNNVSTHIIKYAVEATEIEGVEAIIADTTSGLTVRALSAYRGKKTIFAQCYNKSTMRHLALSWGVYAVFMQPKDRHDEFINSALCMIENNFGVSENAIFIIVAGSFGRRSGTTFIEISEISNLKKKYR